LKHSSSLATTYFTPTDMTFGGTPTFPQLSTTQAGADYALTLKNFGGVFKPQVMSFKGKFVNVTGTASKNLTVSLEKKLKTSSTWSYVKDTFTNTLGKFFFTDVPIDTTAWDVRIAVKGDTMGVGAIVSTSDAQRINQYVLGTQSMTGFDFYSSDVNGDNTVSISDVYGVYARVSGRFTAWSNSVKDVKFFTVSEYGTINGSTTNYTSSVAGVTNFTYQIIAGQPDSVTYYVVCPGDANGTGYNRARMTPIEIVNPNNANKRIIDVTTAYDNILESIEVNFPKLGVDAGDVVNIPVKLKTGGIDLGSLQVCMKYDSSLLTFKGVKNELKTSYWISFINASNNMVEWGGYDPSNNQHLVKDGDMFFTLQFESKKPQNDWGKSPLYVQRKFAGNALATDLNISPTDGIIQVFRMGNGTNDFKDMILYPNPFEGDVTIGFKIYEEGKNIIGIYDVNGKQQMEIVPNQTNIGIYSNTVDLSFLPPGTYLAVLRNEEKTTTKKAVKTN
jgi:Secretion system C-terminal sorting domain